MMMNSSFLSLFFLFLLTVVPAVFTTMSVEEKKRDVYVGNGCFWALQHLVITEFENATRITAVRIFQNIHSNLQ